MAPRQPEMHPGWPKRAPRRAQEGDHEPKNLAFRPKRPPGCPKRPKEAPRGPQEDPKTRREAPKRPKTGPKRPQTASSIDRDYDDDDEDEAEDGATNMRTMKTLTMTTTEFWGLFGGSSGSPGNLFGISSGLLWASAGPLRSPSGRVLEISVWASRLGTLFELSWGPLGSSWRPRVPDRHKAPRRPNIAARTGLRCSEGPQNDSQSTNDPRSNST